VASIDDAERDGLPCLLVEPEEMRADDGIRRQPPACQHAKLEDPRTEQIAPACRISREEFRSNEDAEASVDGAAGETGQPDDVRRGQCLTLLERADDFELGSGRMDASVVSQILDHAS